MGTSSTIAPVRATKRSHFIAQKMFAASTPMPRSTENSYLVNEIGFLHEDILAAKVS
jgi:hypothetical protein